MDQSSENKNSGFTLIEVLIVVAILGILMSIAVPAYNEYVRRAHRAAAQQFLLDVAQRQEQYLLDNRQYATALRTAGAPLGAGELDMTFPADVSPYYDGPTFVVNATPPSFLLSMSPKAGKMSDDGTLVVNNTTQKWREPPHSDPPYTYTEGVDKPW